MIDKISPYFKAVAGAVVGAATYIVASGLNYTEPVWWAGLVVFLGAGFGVVWAVPNR